MIKKIFLFLFLCLMAYSCGKKGDPVYEGSKLEIIDTKTKVVL